MKLGFIGLGNMGLPMVRNLARAGHQVQAYDVSAAALREAAQIEGVSITETTAQAAEASEILFTCLPNNQIVTEAYLEEDGVLSGAQPGLVTCDCSTVSPEISVMLNQTLATHQVSHMDVTMLGSTPQAQSGEVFFIVGGAEENMARLEQVLPAMGTKWIYVGPAGSANRVKLIHNYLGAANCAVAAEVLAACVQCGVDPEIFRQVVTQGGGMADTTFFQRRVARILDGEYSPMFALELMHKDASLALALAQDTQAPAGVLEKTLAAYAEAREQGLGQEDFSALARLAERKLGKPIRR